MIIIISGTPATGKTTLAKLLHKRLNGPLLDVNILIKDKKIFENFDKHRDCYVIKIQKLNIEVLREIKKVQRKIKTDFILVDSHLSHHLPKKYVDLCIITKCDLKELKRRLSKRNYSSRKVRENIDAEIFDICLNEAKEQGHNTFVINTTKGINKEALSHLLGEIRCIQKPKN
jgi:adenylate kinase